MTEAIERFLAAFPPSGPGSARVNARGLSADAEKHFQLRTPDSLGMLWERAGSGYFGLNRELYLFGDGASPLPRSSFLEWNALDFWRDIFPRPEDGGPLFFCETCFGEQIGFRWEDDVCIPVVFVLDSFESFRLAENFDEFVKDVLPDRDAIVDLQLVSALVEELGPIPNGMHYAPIVSFLTGGSDQVKNFHFETANVHFRTTIATYEAVSSRSE